MERFLVGMKNLHHSWRLIHRSFSASSFSQQKTVAELTSNRYSHLKRGSYATITEEDMRHFKSILVDDASYLTDEDELLGYNMDWLGIVRGIV